MCGFPGSSYNGSFQKRGDPGSTPGLGRNPWVGTIPWRSEWLSTPVFFPGESHGQRILADYSPLCPKESNMTELLLLSLTGEKNVH